MKRYLFLLLILSVILGCPEIMTAQQTKILTGEKFNEYGLVYTLPKTAVSITVTARKQTFKAGKFYKYAKKFLGTDRVITENSEKWEILSVEATPFGIADSSTQYLMQLKPGVTTFIGVGSDGMILSINADPTPSAVPEPKYSITADPAINADAYLDYVTEDFLASQSTSRQAQMLSEALLETRETRMAIAAGTADNMPSDGKQMELMLASLSAKEKALTEAFTGVSYSQTATKSFSFTPSREGKETLFRLSDFAGFVEANDYSGAPVYVSTKILRRGQLPLDANGEEKKFPKDGVVYAIPGTASITISFQGENLWSREMDVAQFGTTFALNPALFTAKKNPSYAIFSDITGGLVEIGNTTTQQ